MLEVGIHLATLSRKAFSISFLLVVAKPETHCYEQHLNSPQEDEEEKVTGNLAVAKRFSTDATVAAVLSELDFIFTLNLEQTCFSLNY